MTESHTLTHRDALIHISPLNQGRWKVSVEALNKDLYVHQPTCETSYPIDLIQKILDTAGPGFVCDEILRDESPDYVRNFLYYDLLAYVDKEQFKNKTLLDFGCGPGASTMILSRMFPDTKIMGVELDKGLLSIARARAEFYGYDHLTLMTSPSPNDLPPEAVDLDFIVLSGVYEHLLPEERRHLLPRIWKAIKPGGILFLNQTPHSGFPIEIHTTGGLPFLNYLPDRIAHRYAQRCSKRNLKPYSWEKMLRMGIRGGSVKGILRQLGTDSHPPMLLEPSQLGLSDRLDLWYAKYKTIGSPWMIRSFYYGTKAVKLLTGKIMLPNLSLAIKKTSSPEGERVDC